MAFVSDFGTIILIMVLFGASIPVGAAHWMLENITAVAAFLLIKSLFFIGRGFLAKNQRPAYYLTVLITLLLDTVRNGVFLYIGADMLSSMFDNGLFGLILGFFELAIKGGLALLAAEGPAYLVYLCWEGAPSMKKPAKSMLPVAGLCCGLETLSIAALYLLFIM